MKLHIYKYIMYTLYLLAAVISAILTTTDGPQ